MDLLEKLHEDVPVEAKIEAPSPEAMLIMSSLSRISQAINAIGERIAILEHSVYQQGAVWDAFFATHPGSFARMEAMLLEMEAKKEDAGQNQEPKEGDVIQKAPMPVDTYFMTDFSVTADDTLAEEPIPAKPEA
jgi:hypothetical protein